MRKLPGLGGDLGFASAVNSRGVIVGTASDVARHPHAVVWTDDGRRVHDLGVARGDSRSFGTGITAANTVAGDSDSPDGNERAAVFDHAGIVILSGTRSQLGAAEDINAAGRIVGPSFLTTGEQHATIWAAGVAWA